MQQIVDGGLSGGTFGGSKCKGSNTVWVKIFEESTFLDYNYLGGIPQYLVYKFKVNFLGGLIIFGFPVLVRVNNFLGQPECDIGGIHRMPRAMLECGFA